MFFIDFEELQLKKGRNSLNKSGLVTLTNLSKWSELVGSSMAIFRTSLRCETSSTQTFLKRCKILSKLTITVNSTLPKLSFFQTITRCLNLSFRSVTDNSKMSPSSNSLNYSQYPSRDLVRIFTGRVPGSLEC